MRLSENERTVTGMAKYIEREAFLEDAEERYCLPCKGAGKDHNGLKCRACWVDDMCGDIIGAPAADVSPVRHGRWLTWEEQFPGSRPKKTSRLGVFCDKCHNHADNRTDYCPNCGVKMDEVNE